MGDENITKNSAANGPGDLADRYYKEAREYYTEGKYNYALPLLKEANDYYESIGNKDKYFKSLAMLGIIYAVTDNEAGAVECYVNGYERAKADNYPYYQVLFVNNIGSRFQELGEHTTALEYFNQAFELYNDNKDKVQFEESVVTVLYLNIALSLVKLGRYDEAEKSVEILEKFQKETISFYYFLVAYVRCRIELVKGNSTFVHKRVAELIDEIAENKITMDFSQFALEFISLITEIEEYGLLDKMVCICEEHAKKSDNLADGIKAVEYRLMYYKALEMQQEYARECVKYVDMQNKLASAARIAKKENLELKINLIKMEQQQKMIENDNQMLKTKSEIDALTHMYNRAALISYGEDGFAADIENESGIAAGIIDVDCFKQYNDCYGHIKGDECLILVADILKESVGTHGNVYRYGGDEFVIVLKNTDEHLTGLIAADIKERINNKHIPSANSTVCQWVTLSMGFACRQLEQGDTLKWLLGKADEVLYEVKKQSKNNYMVKSIEQ